MSNWALKTLRVLEKELRTEYRTRYAFNAMMLFCLTCVAVASFALGGRAGDPRIQAALLWILVFFAAMSGLSRTFVKEQEVGTINLLRVSCDPIPVFLGKALFNLLLLLSMLAALSVLFPLFLGAVIRNWPFFLISASAAALSISILSTTISAIVAGARVRGTLFPILSFPVLLPVLFTAVQATQRAMEGGTIAANMNLVFFLGAFAGAALIVCSFLFEILFYD